MKKPYPLRGTRLKLTPPGLPEGYSLEGIADGMGGFESVDLLYAGRLVANLLSEAAAIELAIDLSRRSKPSEDPGPSTFKP